MLTQINGKHKRELVSPKKWSLKDWIYIIIGIGVICGGGVASNIFKPVKKAVAIYQAPVEVEKLTKRVDKVEKYVDVNYENIQKICGALKVKPDSVKVSIFDND